MSSSINSNFLSLGAQGNLAGHANDAATLIARLSAGSRIASATAKLTRAQILQQAASAVMTQANGEPRAVLALLR